MFSIPVKKKIVIAERKICLHHDKKKKLQHTVSSKLVKSTSKVSSSLYCFTFCIRNKRHGRKMTILLVFCPCMLCSNTVPLSPCGGSLCVEKKRTEIGAETRYLMLSMGTSTLTSSGVLAISQTTYLVLILPLKDAAVLQ